MEFGLNLPVALTTLPKTLVIAENICDRKSFKVSVCGIEELESNVMHKLGVDLIQYPIYSCVGVYTSSQTQEVPLSYATTCTRMKHLALEMVKGDVCNQNTKKHGH